MSEQLGRPAWLKRTLDMGVTPKLVQEYLDQGWPTVSIAERLGLDADVMDQLMERWDLNLPVSKKKGK